MSKFEKTLVGTLVGMFCYGGVVLLAFGAMAFVQDTGDFTAWGADGRAGTMVLSGVGTFLATIAFEIGGMRSNLRDALIEHMENRP